MFLFMIIATNLKHNIKGKIPVVMGASIVMELLRALSSQPEESLETVDAFEELCFVLQCREIATTSSPITANPTAFWSDVCISASNLYSLESNDDFRLIGKLETSKICKCRKKHFSLILFESEII